MAYDEKDIDPTKKKSSMARGGAPFSSNPLNRSRPVDNMVKGYGGGSLADAAMGGSDASPMIPPANPSIKPAMPQPLGVGAAGAVTGLSRAGAMPQTPPPSANFMPASSAAMAPRPQVGAPLRSAMAPAAAGSTPQIPATFGIAPYVSQARQMTTGVNPAVLNSAVPSVSPNPQGAPGFASQAVPTPATPLLGRGPQPQNPNPLISDRDRETAAMQGRMGTVNDIQSGKLDYTTAVRNGMTPEQAKAMGLTPPPVQATDAMRRGNALLTGGQNITPRAQAQGMFAEPMDPKEAQAKLDAGGKGKPRSAEAKARGEANYARVKEQDALRRATDPIAQMNMARAQGRKEELAEKRSVREQKGAANRLFAAGLGQGDPRVKSQMLGQAGDMVRDIGARVPLDDRRRQAQIEMAKTRINDSRYDARDQKYQAEAGKARAETEAMRGRMSDIDRASFDAFTAALGKIDPSTNQDLYNDFLNKINEIRGRYNGGQGGGGNQPPSQADLEYTAKKHGITVEEVKKRMGIK